MFDSVLWTTLTPSISGDYIVAICEGEWGTERSSLVVTSSCCAISTTLLTKHIVCELILTISYDDFCTFHFFSIFFIHTVIYSEVNLTILPGSSSLGHWAWRDGGPPSLRR